MPRFYSPEWVEAFNEAVAGVGVETAQSPDPGTAATYRVAQVVRNRPDGAGGEEACVILEVSDGRLRLELPREPAWEADVTVVMDYADAVALSRGELDPSDALAGGRIRVRGNLSVLVAGQRLLAAAADRLGGLRAVTTY